MDVNTGKLLENFQLNLFWSKSSRPPCCLSGCYLVPISIFMACKKVRHVNFILKRICEGCAKVRWIMVICTVRWRRRGGMVIRRRHRARVRRAPAHTDEMSYQSRSVCFTPLILSDPISCYGFIFGINNHMIWTVFFIKKVSQYYSSVYLYLLTNFPKCFGLPNVYLWKLRD